MSNYKRYIDFLWAMTEKEIKARYKRAVFGFLWVILNPLLQMAIIGFIFSFFINVPNYYLFLFTGLLPWTFFSLSISRSTPSLVYERSLLQKTKFPTEVIPVSIVLSNFIHMLISMVLLILFLLATSSIFLPQILLLIPALVWLLVFTIGLSLFTSTLQVRFRDVNFFIQTALMLWFYATPILYDISLIPDALRPLFTLNPLTSVFELIRVSLLNQGAINYQLMAGNLLISLVLVVLGIAVFAKQRKYFVDWL